MAASGLLLILFVIGHLAGNLQVFLGADTFNTYSHFLHSTGELLWIARIVLLVAVLLHIYTAIRLQAINMKANPQKYVKKGYRKSTVYSRTMLVSGLMLLAFIVYHLLHYTVRITDPEYKTQAYYETYGTQIKGAGLEIAIDDNVTFDAEDTHAGILQRHDTYSMVIDGFKKPHIAIIYVIGVILLGMHLTHALQSMFQTLGLSSPIFSPKVMALSKWFGWLITVLYSSIPLSIMLGLIGGGQ
jgi:succinate dehydrogenase / fumarate reductase cytochrome b subunit